MHFIAFKFSSLPDHLLRLLVCAFLCLCIQTATAGRMTSAATAPSLVKTPGQPAAAPRSSPYLLVCLPPPLRFAAPLPVLTAVPSRPATEEPPPAFDVNEDITDPAPDVSISPSLPASTKPDAAAEINAPADPAAAPAKAGVSILPDETPREIRAEDVLLYFRFPTTAPASSLPPPSSATYQQQ